METPADAITALIESGLTEQAIADRLGEIGVSVTQSTIHRIKAGDIKQPKYHVGMALVTLREQMRAATA